MSVESYIQSLPKPISSITVNGSYIEDLIPGYRTKSASARDTRQFTIGEYSNNTRDGAIFRSRKRNVTEVTVSFLITCSTSILARRAMRKLRAILDDDELEIVFTNEPDVFFKAAVKSITDSGSINAISSDVYVVGGEFVLYSSDPNRYSVVQHTVSSDNNLTATFTYEGSYDAHPIIEITPTTDLKSASFSTLDGKVLQIGSTTSPTTIATAMQVILLDTEDASITINGTASPQVGNIDNQWEQFKIQNGSNTISCIAHNEGSTLTFRVLYREVY